MSRSMAAEPRTCHILNTRLTILFSPSQQRLCSCHGHCRYGLGLERTSNVLNDRRLTPGLTLPTPGLLLPTQSAFPIAGSAGVGTGKTNFSPMRWGRIHHVLVQYIRQPLLLHITATPIWPPFSHSIRVSQGRSHYDLLPAVDIARAARLAARPRAVFGIRNMAETGMGLKLYRKPQARGLVLIGVTWSPSPHRQEHLFSSVHDAGCSQSRSSQRSFRLIASSANTNVACPPVVIPPFLLHRDLEGACKCNSQAPQHILSSLQRRAALGNSAELCTAPKLQVPQNCSRTVRASEQIHVATW